jgi:hypothetical protein
MGGVVTLPDIHIAPPLGPVRATLAAMANVPGAPPVDGLAPDLTVTDPLGWLRASALTRGEALDGLLVTAAARWDAPAHVAAALAWKTYTYWLALPAVVGFASCRRIPLLRPESVLLRYSRRRPFLTLGLTGPVVAVLPNDPIAATAGEGVQVVRDEEEMLDLLRQTLRDQHLEPLLARIRDRVRLSAHTLWGSLASGVAHAMSRSAEATPGPTLATTRRLLRALDVEHLVELSERPQGGLEVQRRTCCLAFTLPQPKVCSGCCIR